MSMAKVDFTVPVSMRGQDRMTKVINTNYECKRLRTECQGMLLAANLINNTYECKRLRTECG